jgi:hypothetical protein
MRHSVAHNMMLQELAIGRSLGLAILSPCIHVPAWEFQIWAIPTGNTTVGARSSGTTIESTISRVSFSVYLGSGPR